MSDMTEPPPPTELPYEADTNFIRVLDATGCALAISVYMTGRVILVSAESGRLVIHARAFERPMGIALTTTEGAMRIALATMDKVVMLADEPMLAPFVPNETNRYRHLFVPRSLLFTGEIDAHDLVWAGNRLFVANTLFSCISEVDSRRSFTPVWQPPFVTKLMPDDRCHLNGIAMDGDRIAYVSAFSQTDEIRGWHTTRLTSGVLLDLPDGNVVLDGLCMPHSPRLLDGQLYILNSGHGEVLAVDPAQRTSRVLASLPGFTRGLDRIGDVLFVGLTRPRENKELRLPIEDRHETLVCGVAAVERRSGRVLGSLRFVEGHDEIFDVKVLPNSRHAGILGLGDETHRMALVLPGRAFWRNPDADEK